LSYNARDLAVVRAKMHHGIALLGSATPSVQSYYNVEAGKYVLARLTRRIEYRSLPEVTVVDLRASRDSRGYRRIISQPLYRALQSTLERGEQALLFLNRRGFASYPVCAACGASIKCPHCDISLTLHQSAGAYKCHYCGFSRAVASTCPACAAPHIKNLGLGTEKIEGLIQSLFPTARVARMDADTTAGKGALLGLLKGLRNRTIDILVGTQMVAKGHDFPHITLVGILCADLSLNFPDFRAGERTFQLLAQVSGRAGRGTAPGRVVLQTYNPDHFSIAAAEQHDFEAFCRQELRFRKELNYPPFTRMIQIKLACKDPVLARQQAQLLGDICQRLRKSRKDFSKSVEILGPIEAPLSRLAGYYRWQILLKGHPVKILHRFAQILMFEKQTLWRNRHVRVAVDVDPFSMM
jgi:primosomal protein N' (replication factor Y)